jgi:hypothetical protein
MNRLTPSSRRAFVVCPLCEKGRLQASHQDSTSCDSCSGFLSGVTLRTHCQIAALPDASGGHVCECGYPEMRLLPDGTYHCPSCGSEVLPLGTPPVDWTFDEHGEAYWAGWVDGRFREIGCFTENLSLAKWEDPSDRLDFYRGHRAGSEARRTKRLGRKGRVIEEGGVS